MSNKFVPLTPELQDYISRCHSQVDDPLLADLRKETESLGGISEMQVSAEQGTFLSILVASLGVKNAVEVGTFTGYSSLCTARAMGPDGRLDCYDQSEEWTSIARKYWDKADLSDRITLHVGDAAKLLAELPEKPLFDFAFVDADKTGYDTYYELLLPRLHTGSLILFDNMLWKGRLVPGPLTDPNGKAIDELNRKLATDPRVESILLTLADGIHMCRKK